MAPSKPVYQDHSELPAVISAAFAAGVEVGVFLSLKHFLHLASGTPFPLLPTPWLPLLCIPYWFLLVSQYPLGLEYPPPREALPSAIFKCTPPSPTPLGVHFLHSTHLTVCLSLFCCRLCRPHPH